MAQLAVSIISHDDGCKREMARMLSERLGTKVEPAFVSAAPGANARGQTADVLLVANEAQDILPDTWDAVFDPMAASTNAPTLVTAGFEPANVDATIIAHRAMTSRAASAICCWR